MAGVGWDLRSFQLNPADDDDDDGVNDGEGHLGRTECDPPAGRRTCCIPWLSRLLCAQRFLPGFFPRSSRQVHSSWALLPGVVPGQTNPLSMSHKLGDGKCPLGHLAQLLLQLGAAPGRTFSMDFSHPL